MTAAREPRGDRGQRRRPLRRRRRRRARLRPPQLRELREQPSSRDAAVGRARPCSPRAGRRHLLRDRVVACGRTTVTRRAPRLSAAAAGAAPRRAARRCAPRRGTRGRQVAGPARPLDARVRVAAAAASRPRGHAVLLGGAGVAITGAYGSPPPWARRPRAAARRESRAGARSTALAEMASGTPVRVCDQSRCAPRRVDDLDVDRLGRPVRLSSTLSARPARQHARRAAACRARCSILPNATSRAGSKVERHCARRRDTRTPQSLSRRRLPDSWRPTLARNARDDRSTLEACR